MSGPREERSALLSSCKQYRYLLRRVWEPLGIIVLFVMLNPSTADADIDDATIRSLRRLCKAAGYGGFEVVNLFGWRATHPNELRTVDNPIGLPDNDRVIVAAMKRCDLVICAWGAHPMVNERGEYMFRLISMRFSQAYCFGTTKAGHPRHPLYIKTGTELVPINR